MAKKEKQALKFSPGERILIPILQHMIRQNKKRCRKRSVWTWHVRDIEQEIRSLWYISPPDHSDECKTIKKISNLHEDWREALGMYWSEELNQKKADRIEAQLVKLLGEKPDKYDIFPGGWFERHIKQCSCCRRHRDKYLKEHVMEIKTHEQRKKCKNGHDGGSVYRRPGDLKLILERLEKKGLLKVYGRAEDKPELANDLKKLLELEKQGHIRLVRLFPRELQVEMGTDLLKINPCDTCTRRIRCAINQGKHY